MTRVINFSAVGLRGPHFDDRFVITDPRFAGGAPTDGVSDSRPAIQAAVDACFAAGGGEVLVPPGEFVGNLGQFVTLTDGPYGALVVQKPGVVLRGVGWESRLKVMSGQSTGLYGGSAVMNNDPFASTQELFIIRDLSIDCNKAGQTRGSLTQPLEWEAVNYKGGTKVLLDNVLLKNAMGDGVDFDRGGWGILRGVRVEDCDGYAAHVAGWASTYAKRVLITGCSSFRNGIVSVRGGFHLSADMEDSEIVDSYSEGDYIGIVLEAATASASRNRIRTSVLYGIQVNSTATLSEVTENDVTSSGNDGIRSTSPSVAIRGNVLNLVGAIGINIAAGRADLLGNRVIKSATSGIFTNTTCSRCSIVANYVENAGNGTSQYAIRPSGPYAIIRGNRVYTGALGIVLPATALGSIVTGNMTDSLTGGAAGVETSAAPDCVVADNLVVNHTFGTKITAHATSVVAGNQPPVIPAAITAKTAAYTVTIYDADRPITADATAGAFTITLPLASTVQGKTFTFKKIDVSANAVTLDPNGSQTIDGALTKALSTQYETVRLVSTGTAWMIV